MYHIIMPYHTHQKTHFYTKLVDQLVTSQVVGITSARPIFWGLGLHVVVKAMKHSQRIWRCHSQIPGHMAIPTKDMNSPS